jgi:hypothetical protein
MSWAYADKPEMTAKLAEAYTVAGNANIALVIPAGLAFARVVKERPDLVLYQPDNRHPTLIGTYLATSTVYSALLHRAERHRLLGQYGQPARGGAGDRHRRR